MEHISSKEPESARRRQSNQTTQSHRRRTTLSKIFTGLSLRKQENELPEDTVGAHGLNLLVDSAEPLADLVFVHGLGGGSRKTWDKGRDPQLYWPKEWLSRDLEFRHVRVHSFGYHADWAERQESVLNIHDFANSLLAQLQASSTIRRSKSVPIIFVCHSMGGLVVKRAFILSHHDVGFQELSKRINTIYFLATPHHGAGSAQLLSALIKLSNSGNRPFLSDLKSDSPAIQAINDEFRHYSNQVRLYSFFETKPTHILGVGNIFLVSKSSAIMQLPQERVIPLEADHPGVCKYLSPSDPNYMLVRDSIVETLDHITETWQMTNAETIKDQKRKLRAFLRMSGSLAPLGIDLDEPIVRGSCEWLTLEPSFRRWCDALEPQVFWLNGNPGTGKTFLAKHVATHVNELGHDCSYFFFSAGDKVNSSITGCLLSLAWQMAESNVFIRDTFLEMQDINSSFNPESFQSIWRNLFVGGVFQTKLVKPHFWILDGLDECVDYVELFPLLAKITSNFPLQIFLSSRPSPEYRSQFLSHGLKAEMYYLNRDKTAADIKRYVEAHVDFPSFQVSSEKQKLIATINKKSEGSFMWVRLILKELRGAFSEEATKKILRNVPKGMDNMYRRSLEPLAKEETKLSVAKAILMWSSACIRHLSTTELKHALIIHVNETYNRLEDHISWLCGFLVIVDSQSTVKMVHETARRFILDKSNGTAVAFSEAEAHECLAITCLKYLNDKELKAPRGRRSSGAQASMTRSPFFPYAAVAFHEHIQRSKSVSEEILDLVLSFCSSSGGNILSWIDYIASTDKGIATIVGVGTSLRAFALRISRDRMRRTEKLDLIHSWSTDLIRIAAKFGRNLERFPPSIYTMIPQFCPRKSSMFRQYGQTHRSLGVHGIYSLHEWDDCLATIAYKNKGNRTISVASTTNMFAVGMSGSLVRLYLTSTCQEYAVFDHGESVEVVEFSLSGHMLATSGNCKLRVWNVGSKSLAWEAILMTACIALTFDSESDEIVVACQDNRLYYFQLESGNLQDEIPWFMDEDHAETITRVPSTAAFSYQHHLLAFVYRGGHIGLWNWDTDEFLGLCMKPGASKKRCPFHASSLVFSPVPNSKSLAASYEQGEILVFDPIEGDIKASYKANTDNQTLACSPDGRTLLAGDSAGVVRILDFQSFDSEDGKLRLLHVVSGVEEPIRALAFLDDRRYVDLRGRKIKIWEPTALVRSEVTLSDTESIVSEDNSYPESRTDDGESITAMSVHVNGKHIFCGTQNGLIKVFDTATGRRLQIVSDRSSGDTILWMVLSSSGSIIATAGISSKVIIHRMAFKKHWKLEQKVFEYRMGEPIEQLLFNKDNTKILVVTTTRDLVYSVEEEREIASARWETRMPGMWCNDPRDSDHLLLWVNQTLRVFTWSSFSEISPAAGFELQFQLPPNFGIRNIFSGWNDSYIATIYSHVDYPRSNTRILFWCSEDFPPDKPDATSVSPISPIYPLYGQSISEQIGTLGMVVGLSGNRVLFLDQDGWICSFFLEDCAPMSYSRHFFLPVDWLSTNDALLAAWITNGQVLFTRGDELAVIKRGLDLSQEVQLPVQSKSLSSDS